MKRPKPGQLVYVELDDIEHDNNGWTNVSAIRGQRPRTYKAVGYVVKATKRTLTLASMSVSESRDPGGGAAFCNYMLPWPSVRKIVKL